MKLLFWVAVAVAGACATAKTSKPPSPPRNTNLGLQIVPATLPNGLRVVLVSDPKSSEVQVTMRYQVGANDDPTGQEGIAHLVEHVMFQPVLGAKSVFARLRDATTYFNGTTSFDATTYTSRAKAERLAELLSIESVRLGFRCAWLSDSVFERERQVVVNELRLREAGREKWFALLKALYPAGHPYGRGNHAETVATVTREQACAFAESHYAPANAVLVISGPVTMQQANEALEKFIVKVPSRNVQPPQAVPAVPATFRRIDATAPIEDKSIIIAWALPRDPAVQATVTVAARRVVTEIEDRGLSTNWYRFGGVAAPMLGVYVELGSEEKRTTEKILSEIEAAVRGVPASYRITKYGWIDQAVFDRMKQGAIYQLFSSLEEGSERDEEIAATVLAGRDPNATAIAQAKAINNLSPEQLERLADTHLRYDQATVAVLTPSESKRGASVPISAPVHEMGQRGELPDPAEALRPADPDLAPQAAIAGMRKRTLDNGLEVVLLPVTSVPTVEARLVFASGTADEPAADHGAARAAAHMLRFSPDHVRDFIDFATSGSTTGVSVGLDHTTFTVRGVDMHLDFLLTGLRRSVLDASYEVKDIAAIRKAARRGKDDGAVDTWRAALFGASHPYAHADDVSTTLTLAAVAAYRKQHHTPGNATLVIAGRFDPDLADKWIDHLFASWQGKAPFSETVHATTEPVSFAIDDEEVTQVAVAIALPAGQGSRAEQLVAANMLNVIAEDIRHQLAASYAFAAELDEARLASTYVMAGWLDAPRARDAFELVRLRLAALRSDPEAAARTFVTARRRVMVSLLRSTSSAHALARRVQNDVALERAPLSDARTAAEVNGLTIDRMPSVLAELDLSRAVVVMRGPRATIDDAFAALGRTPKRIAATSDVGERELTPDHDFAADADIEDPSAPSGARWMVGAFLGYEVATALEQGLEGWGVSADVGYRLTRKFAAGAHVSAADVSGTRVASLITEEPLDVSASVFRLMGFLQASAADDRLWGALFLGLSFVDTKDDKVLKSSIGLGLGVHGGFDVANFGKHHITVYGRLDADIETSTSYAGFTFGAGYRYR